MIVSVKDVDSEGDDSDDDPKSRTRRKKRSRGRGTVSPDRSARFLGEGSSSGNDADCGNN